MLNNTETFLQSPKFLLLSKKCLNFYSLNFNDKNVEITVLISNLFTRNILKYSLKETQNFTKKWIKHSFEIKDHGVFKVCVLQFFFLLKKK